VKIQNLGAAFQGNILPQFSE